VHSELGVLRGGGENFTRSLFCAFAERGHDVSAAFIADSDGRYPFLLPGKIRPIPLTGRWSRKLGQVFLSNVARRIPPGTRLRTSWDRLQEAFCWRSVRWHDRRFSRRIELEFECSWKEYDAVFVHGSVELASRIARHCPTVLRLPGRVPVNVAPMLKSVHAVCANGDVLSYIRGFLGDHALEVPIGLDSELFTPGLSCIRRQLGWTENHWVVGYVGRLAYIKGVDLLAEAFKEMRKINPHARLLIVGSGEEEEKLRSSLRSELAGGVAYLESDVPHELLADWYRAMDVFVMPSRYENCSNAVLEALACGVPFLGSDVEGNRRLVETEGGWLFPHGSAESLAHILHSLSEDPCITRDQNVAKAERVRRCYSWEVSAKQLEDIFLSCRHRKAHSPCRP
jgi:glycosyltransferase involved in cell wall biosynthesis